MAWQRSAQHSSHSCIGKNRRHITMTLLQMDQSVMLLIRTLSALLVSRLFCCQIEQRCTFPVNFPHIHHHECTCTQPSLRHVLKHSTLISECDAWCGIDVTLLCLTLSNIPAKLQAAACMDLGQLGAGSALSRCIRDAVQESALSPTRMRAGPVAYTGMLAVPQAPPQNQIQCSSSSSSRIAACAVGRSPICSMHTCQYYTVAACSTGSAYESHQWRKPHADKVQE